MQAWKDLLLVELPLANAASSHGARSALKLESLPTGPPCRVPLAMTTQLKITHQAKQTLLTASLPQTPGHREWCKASATRASSLALKECGKAENEFACTVNLLE